MTHAAERIRKLENSLCATNIRALARMQEAGTVVLFEGGLPEICIGEGDAKELSAQFKAVSDDDILAAIKDSTSDFRLDTENGRLVHAKYVMKDGRELYLVSNRARNDAHVVCRRTKDGVGSERATLLCPDDGTIREISLAEPFAIPAARAVFLMF